MKKMMSQRGLAFLLALCMTLSLLPGWVSAADVEPPSGIVDETETVYSSGYWGTESSGVAWATVNGGSKLYVFPTNPSASGVISAGSLYSGTNKGAPSNYRSITEVVICEGITWIGAFQFYQWSSLLKLSLPESLTTVDSTTFYECGKLRELNLGKCTVKLNIYHSPLETITVDPGNTAYKVEGSALLSQDGKIFYYLAGNPSAYTVPDGVEDIEWRAFFNSTNLTKIHLPASLKKTIDYRVFEQTPMTGSVGTYRLKDLYLPQDLTTLKLSIGASDITNALNIHYPGTPDELQGYTNGANYLKARGGKDSFFFGEDDTPALKITWKNEENGTVVKTGLVMAGDTVTLPADSTGFTAPTGGSFQGSFYFDRALKSAGESVAMPNHDVVLYPNWYGNAVTVTLDVNGHGTLQNTTLILDAGNSYGTALPDSLTAENYAFLGWFTDAQGGTEITAGSKVPAGNHTLYAHWAENPKYTVTLDLNDGSGGASVSPNSYEVYYPGKYPALATPSWTGHIFDGWFTSADGGSQVKAGDAVAQGAAHTLYAHWTEIIDVQVTLDAGEGTVAQQTVTASYPGGTYPALPVPERQGYTFQGWFSEADGGSQIRSGDAVAQGTAHTLYARWEKIPDTYTLTLDPDGGSLAATNLQLTEGKSYPNLPTPTKPGFDFSGWFSEKNGGKRVFSGNALLQNADHTLYAHYTQSVSHDNTTVLNYSFKFSNSNHGFDYPADYKIPLKRYQEVFGDTARARTLYEYSREWGGSCSGMAVTSALLYLPNPDNKPIRVQDFKQGPWQGTASTLYEKIMDMEIYGQHKNWQYSLRSLIEGMQISQGGADSGIFAGSAYSLQRVFELVQQETTGSDPKPVYLAVYRQGGGHALLAYEAKVVSDTEARLYVYDCNYPGNGNRYVTLTKSVPGGNYDSFVYMGGYTYSSSMYAKSFRNDAYPVWLGNVDSKPPLDALMNLICVGAKKAKIIDANGNVVAIVNGDGTTTTTAGVEELRMVADALDQNGDPMETGIPETYAFFVPRGQYTIVNMDEGAGNLEVSVSNIERSATVETSANTMTVIVDDEQDVSYVRIEDANADYKIALGNSPTDENGNHFVEYLLTGSTDRDPVAIARKDGETLTENVDLTQAGVSFSTRVDAEVYHDVDLDAIAAECQGAADYANAFAQKAAEAVAAAKAADAADPPQDSGWSTVTEEAEKPRPITGGDLGAYKPMDSVHGGTATGEKPVNPGHSGSGAGSDKPMTSANLPATPPAPENPFSDVVKDVYYYDAVLWAVEEGIIKGTSEHTFAPDRFCTRAEMAAMFYRAAGEPVVTGESPFQDAAADAYYRDAAIWAYQSGIVKGTSEHTFAPDLPCTRAQIVAMLYRTAGEPAVTGEAPFRDVTAGAYYYDAVIWAYQNGIVKGTAADAFSPDAACTRAMAAVMLYRAK